AFLIPVRDKDDGWQYRACGRIMVQQDGRIKPLDTVARVGLAQVSYLQSYRDDKKVAQPAMRWLLQAMTAQIRPTTNRQPTDEEREQGMVADFDRPLIPLSKEEVAFLKLSVREEPIYSYSEVIAAVRPYREKLEKYMESDARPSEEDRKLFMK